MQVFIATLQKFMKSYEGEKWCNDKIVWLNSRIRLSKNKLPIMKKFAETGITDYEHLLSPERKYLSYMIF